MQDVSHRVKTVDACLAACRLGNKYGVRCLTRHQEEVHAELVPNRPYVKCTVKVIYRLEPLPAGTQRQSLVKSLQTWGWLAKPLHACPGSQGKAWLVGTEVEPPAPFIEAQHGWVSVSKVKDQAVQQRAPDIIATARTKQHIQGASTPASSSKADPWHNGSDPWANFCGTKAATMLPQGPTHHAQQKFDEVEQKLQDQVQAHVSDHLQKADEAATHRMTVVEDQIQHLVENQQKLQHWIQDGSSKMQQLQDDQLQLHQGLRQCAAQTAENSQAIAGAVHEIGVCNANLQQQSFQMQAVAQDVTSIRESLGSTLESYFERQTEKIDQLLKKRQRPEGE